MPEDSDKTKMAPSRRPSEDDADDAYHEYLWGEASPRSFARRAKIAGTKKENSRNVWTVTVDASVDASAFVSR